MKILLTGFAVALVIVVAAAMSPWIDGSGMMDWDDTTVFESNGQRIYVLGTSGSGAPIVPRGGGGMTGMHMSMMGGGCATCHGVNRQGRRLMPRFWIVAPPLTSDALFGGHDADEPEDGHGDHESYTEETLARAIRQGIDPNGDPIDLAMPRWSMSDGDMKDLIDYLKRKTNHSN